MILVKIISALAVLLLAAGCGLFTLPQPNYLYSAKEKDPVLIFNSEFALETFFSVNIDPASDNSCQEFRRVGHIKNIDPRGSSRWEQIKEFKIQVPADQAVTVRAMYSSGSNIVIHCGPVYQSFTPKKGGAYRVKMEIIPDDALRPKDGGKLFGVLASAALGIGQFQSNDTSQVVDTGFPFQAKICGGCNILCDDTSPPYGYCRLRITNDTDKSPVTVTRYFRTCKPSPGAVNPESRFCVR